tara:strand:- start:62 stop:379 length:318 start_codon:yes stop_codon:yes gene_type:complete
MIGRPKGSKNKPQRALQQAIEARLKRIYGKEWDVILELADSAVSIQKIAKQTGEVADLRESVQALNTLAKYLVPTLKATEITTGDNGLTVSIQRKKYDGSDNGDS